MGDATFEGTRLVNMRTTFFYSPVSHIVSYTKSKYSSNSKFVGRRLLRGRVIVEGRRIVISTKPYVDVH